MSGTSSPRRHRVATIAASVSIGLAGVAWAGCGESGEEQAIDEAQQQLEEGLDQADEQIEEAADEAQELQEEAEQQLGDETGETP